MAPRIVKSLLGLLLLPLAAQAIFSAKSDVVQLTEDNFRDNVLKNDGVVLVKFFAPWCGHCRNAAPDWEKAATALKGVVTVAAIDASASQKIASKYQIQGFPTIKVFGADKKSPTDYKGARTADAIVTEGLAAARKLVKDRMSGGSKSSGSSGGSSSSSGGSRKSSGGSSGGSGSGEAVVTLTDANFKDEVVGSKDLWLVAFTAPWCGHCVRLKPEWTEAAKKLKGQVRFGWLDATAHQQFASQFGVQGYPTIKVFPAGKKKGLRDFVDYSGPREAQGIVDYAVGLLEKYGAPPEVNQLVSNAVFDETCSGPIICLLAALPHIVDTGKKGRQAYLDVLMQVATKNRKSPIRVLWTEGGAQPEAESALGLTFGFPAIAALSKDKGVFATFKGSFDADKISGFITGLTTGREATAPLPGGAISFHKVQAWDGKDAPVMEEEEFSLEDILGEEL